MQTDYSPNLQGRRGFTLTELLVASTVGMLVIGGVVASFNQYRRTIVSQKAVAEIQQNLRIGLTTLQRDLSMAGYGLNIPDSQLSRWLSWAPMSSNPDIIPGAGDHPDEIRMAAAYDPITTLAQAASNRTSRLIVAAGMGGQFNTSTRKLIYVNKCELVRIVSISGDILNISTDPSLNAPLRYSHPAGAPIELVKVYRYAIIPPEAGWDWLPWCLKRSDEAQGNGLWIQDAITAGIETMQFTITDSIVDIRLRGRALKPDLSHKDPVFGDNYHRLTVDDSVFMRNL